MVTHLARVARTKLLASQPTIRTPLLSSSSWLKSPLITYLELEQLQSVSLTSSQLEQVEQLRVYLVLLSGRLPVTLHQVGHMLQLTRSAAKHRSAGKRRSEVNNLNLSTRDLWLKQAADDVRRKNPHMSALAISVKLASNPATFKTRHFRPIGPESIRKIIAKER